MNADQDAEFSFSIDLPARNEWENVDLLRTSILNCFTAMFHNVEHCQALAMITGELLENAVKYGDWDRDRAYLNAPAARHLRLRVWGAGREAHVSVENPIGDDSRHIQRLHETLAWLKGFASAEEAYRARLLEIAASTDQHVEGGLGLARVAYEGNCTLRADVQAPGVLCVTADLALTA